MLSRILEHEKARASNIHKAVATAERKHHLNEE
jgi:hypothetical protein